MGNRISKAVRGKTNVECPKCSNSRALVYHRDKDDFPYSYKCRGCGYIYSAKKFYQCSDERYVTMFVFDGHQACYVKDYGMVCNGRFTTNGSVTLLAEVVSGWIQKYAKLVTNNQLDIEIENFADKALLEASMRRFMEKTNEAKGW
jgi:ribosomal protein S27AE